MCEIDERPLQDIESEMNESDLFKEEPRLFDNLCSTQHLRIGFEQVKKNKGKPGIDVIGILKMLENWRFENEDFLPSMFQ